MSTLYQVLCYKLGRNNKKSSSLKKGNVGVQNRGPHPRSSAKGEALTKFSDKKLDLLASRVGCSKLQQIMA